MKDWISKKIISKVLKKICDMYKMNNLSHYEFSLWWAWSNSKANCKILAYKREEGTILLRLKENKSWKHKVPTMQQSFRLKTVPSLLPSPCCWRLPSHQIQNERRKVQKMKKTERKENGRWVKPHFRFFYLRPKNESPDNSHTFGPHNWKKGQQSLVTARLKLKMELFFFLFLLLTESV